MAGESVWIVTWLPLTPPVVGRKREALSPEHNEFDDLRNAVTFVMGPDESRQATATIRLPGDDAFGLGCARCSMAFIKLVDSPISAAPVARLSSNEAPANAIPRQSSHQ
jgi:hypothetical protein